MLDAVTSSGLNQLRHKVKRGVAISSNSSLGTLCVREKNCNITLLSSQQNIRRVMHDKKDPELTPILGDVSSRTNKVLTSTIPHVATLSRRARILLVLCILFTELCERLTFYGIVANLVLYCRDYLKLEAPLPSSISLAFQGNWFSFLCQRGNLHNFQYSNPRTDKLRRSWNAKYHIVTTIWCTYHSVNDQTVNHHTMCTPTCTTQCKDPG